MASPATIVIETASPVEPIAPATTEPVPLSFPAILRNHALTSRFAHLHEELELRTLAPAKKVSKREDKEGKRWVRRKENARFVGNPHIIYPTKRDLDPARPSTLSTFPIPLPPYLPRSVSLPRAEPPPASPYTANAGRFSLSMRGMRRTLRRAGPRTQALVKAVEEELVNWLSEAVVVVQPEDKGPLGQEEYDFPGRIIGEQEGAREVARSTLKLVWWVQDDAWARYVVHCCARYHDVVSFSKDSPTHRLTHLLRPNVTRPDHAARAALVTPPATDLDLSSLSSYESDVLSSFSDIHSDVAPSDVPSEPENGSGYLSDIPSDRGGLSDIASDSGAEADFEKDRAQSPASIASLYHAAIREAHAWSVDGDGDGELDRAVDSLSIHDSALPHAPVQNGTDNEETPRARRVVSYRTRLWDRTRSASSPSRSPVRRGPRRRMEAPLSVSTGQKAKEIGERDRSFYEYLFE
ncbi:hypothetical protein EW146_g3956 [Bondarzewia mesenterica]|uniref:Uncharacterized protein n=1 Tax=Bondarzewia mesenterica TaxID=1095465 RepID=A0A4S4LWI4_9AGAM|nr:hypothetical protein EW146_g3956 [Bondarzewia mesenterica]